MRTSKNLLQNDVMRIGDDEIDPVTPFEAKFIKSYLASSNGAKAFRDAGGKAKGSTEQANGACRILKRRRVQEALAVHRNEVALSATYGAVQAMREAEEGMAFARETRNANALVKAVELRAKLQGLLIDKHDIRQLGSFSISINGVDDEPIKAGLPIVVPNIPHSLLQKIKENAQEEDDEDL